MAKIAWSILGSGLAIAAAILAVATVRGGAEVVRFVNFARVQRSALASYRAAMFDMATIERTCRSIERSGPAPSVGGTLVYVTSEQVAGSVESDYLRRWISAVRSTDSEASLVLIVSRASTAWNGALATARTNGMSYALFEIRDSKDFRSETGVRAVPSILLLDSRGRVVSASAGFIAANQVVRLARHLQDSDQSPVLFEVTRDAKPIG